MIELIVNNPALSALIALGGLAPIFGGILGFAAVQFKSKVILLSISLIRYYSNSVRPVATPAVAPMLKVSQTARPSTNVLPAVKVPLTILLPLWGLKHLH